MKNSHGAIGAARRQKCAVRRLINAEDIVIMISEFEERLIAFVLERKALHVIRCRKQMLPVT
jgi:hypothetical protein